MSRAAAGWPRTRSHCRSRSAPTDRQAWCQAGFNTSGGTSQALDAVIARFSDLLPAGIRSPRELGTAFLGNDDETIREYAYDGGKVRIGASRQADGSLFVGVVFGPEDWWHSAEPQDMFASIVDR